MVSERKGSENYRPRPTYLILNETCLLASPPITTPHTDNGQADGHQEYGRPANHYVHPAAGEMVAAEGQELREQRLRLDPHGGGGQPAKWRRIEGWQQTADVVEFGHDTVIMITLKKIFF